jgi:DNA-binding HxlR family transcriptional regulator
VIAGKWKVRIIGHLFGGTPSGLASCAACYPESAAAFSPTNCGILEVDGMIHRTQYPAIPPTIEYKLTARGAALRPVLIALERWSNSQRPEVDAEDPGKSGGSRV